MAAAASENVVAPFAQTALLSVSGLGKRLAPGETDASDALSLVLRDGEMLALLGSSGCGTATCLRKGLQIRRRVRI